MNPNVLWMFTIYHQPELWMPYRVRPFAVRSGQSIPADVIGSAASLDLARLLVPPFADQLIPRQPEDAPEIVEVWM